jgi:hypothetical protein
MIIRLRIPFCSIPELARHGSWNRARETIRRPGFGRKYSDNAKTTVHQGLNQGAAANLSLAGQSGVLDNLFPTLAADRAIPAAVAELVVRRHASPHISNPQSICHLFTLLAIRWMRTSAFTWSTIPWTRTSGSMWSTIPWTLKNGFTWSKIRWMRTSGFSRSATPWMHLDAFRSGFSFWLPNHSLQCHHAYGSRQVAPLDQVTELRRK